MIDYTNSQALNDFIHTHELMDSHSHIEFSAIVTIRTAKNNAINRPMNVMAQLDGYNSLGSLSLMDSKLDPNLYPTILEAKWQSFEHVNNEFLLIKGNHTRNANIGTYEVKITPLERIRE